jgi:hypothetical protein
MANNERMDEWITDLQNRLIAACKDQDAEISHLLGEAACALRSARSLPAQASEPDVEKLQESLDWHKASLAAHSGKLASVWDGIREAVAKYGGKPCEGEPFDRLDELLKSLTVAQASEPVATRVPQFIVSKVEQAISAAQNPVGMRTNGPCMAMVEVSQLKRLLHCATATPAPAQGEVAKDAARYRFLEAQCRLGTYRGIISREAIDAAMSSQPGEAAS